MGKLIDGRGRLGGKVSVIDLGIVLLVVMMLIGAYVKFMVLPQTDVTVESVSVRYTLEITNVREWTRNNIREGDAVFSAGVHVGTVVNVESEPFRAIVSGDGEAWWGVVPERYIVLVEVEGTATVTDGRVLVSRTVPIGVGNSSSAFSTRYAGFSATIREIVLYD